jgi:hypothetical protein
VVFFYAFLNQFKAVVLHVCHFVAGEAWDTPFQVHIQQIYDFGTIFGKGLKKENCVNPTSDAFFRCCVRVLHAVITQQHLVVF